MSERIMAPENIAPLDLPALPLDERRHLPTCSAIYFVIGAEDRILYIGRAANLQTRWLAHHRQQQLAGLGSARIAWLEVTDAALLPAIEDACIEHFNPQFNGAQDGQSGRTDVRIMLSLPPDIAAALRIRAKDEATPVSVLVRRWIVEELRRGDAGKHRQAYGP